MSIETGHKYRFISVRPVFLGCFLLVMVTVIAYAPVTGFNFVDFDDQLYVQNNPMVKKGLTWQTIWWAFSTATPITGYWVPLTWFSFLIDYSLYGMNAGGYHLTNLLLHVANVLLLFIVLFRMTGRVLRSGVVACLFALHPLHVESVAWVTERKDVLSTFFWLLTMVAYSRYVKKPARRMRYVLVVGLFVMGLMAKPMLVTLPVVLLLLDYWPLERIGHMGPQSVEKVSVRSRFLLSEKLPMLVIAAMAGIAAIITQKLGGALVPMSEISIDIRIANTLVAYVMYIQKMFWPVGLAGLYPHPGALDFFKPAAAFFLISALTLIAVRFRKLAPHVTVGWFWYLITLAPVSGLIVIGPHAIADRYAYVPLIGLYIALAWSLPVVPVQAFKRKLIYALVAAALISALFTLTRRQVNFWKDSMTLFSRMIEVTTNNYSAHCGLGRALAEQGRYQAAEGQYRLSIAINPNYAVAHFNLGHTLLVTRRTAEATQHFRKAVELQPDYPGYHLNLGVALAVSDNLNEALEHFKQEASLDGDSAGAYYNIANVLNIYGDCKGARKNLKRALEINPKSISAVNLLESIENHCEEKKQ